MLLSFCPRCGWLQHQYLLDLLFLVQVLFAHNAVFLGRTKLEKSCDSIQRPPKTALQTLASRPPRSVPCWFVELLDLCTLLQGDSHVTERKLASRQYFGAFVAAEETTPSSIGNIDDVLLAFPAIFGGIFKASAEVSDTEYGVELFAGASEVGESLQIA